MSSAIKETLRYRAAFKEGCAMLKTRPLSIAMICDMRDSRDEKVFSSGFYLRSSEFILNEKHIDYPVYN
jgi:hypothetical protein